MKSIVLLALLALSALVMTGCATSSPTAGSSTTPPPPPANGERTVVLTGSRIPQSVNFNDPIQNGFNNLDVITAEDIRLSGASTLPKALNRLGAGR